MPGITGFISHADIQNQQSTLERMVGSMKHEAFYNTGTLLEKELGLGVGWVSHAGSYADCNPIWNAQRDIGLVFAGEHFGHFGAGPDARSLVALYEEKGDAFFEALNGVFSGVLIDRRQSKVVLFNDRYGLGRVYFHESADGFYFASEAKALLKVLPETRRLNETGFAEFFSCGCALQDRTLFYGISLLPGASAWTFRPGQPVEKKTYFDRSVWEKQSELPTEEYYKKLDETFTRILPRYFQSQQKVGLSLTGGLDSRMIMANVEPGSGLPCHTFGGMYRECADVRLAKDIARVTRHAHEVIPVTAKFFSEFPDLARRSVFNTDGAMDVTGSVEMFVNRVARGMSPVRLTGNYGSEILRGNVAFKNTTWNEALFAPGFGAQVKTAAAAYTQERKVSRTSFIAFKQVPWFHYARMAVEASQLTVRSPYLDNDLVAVAFRAPESPLVNQMLAHRYIADHSKALAQIPTDRGVVGHNDAPRSKFAVFRQEFMPRVEYVFDYGMPQWLAKVDRIMSPTHWERLFLGRQKFYHFRVWYRNELSGYVKEVLLDPRTLNRPYLNRPYVENIVKAHVSGRGNHTLELHKLLSSELIQRTLIEQA